MEPDRSSVVTSRGPTLLAVAGTALIAVAVASMVVRGRSVEVFYARWLFHNAPVGVALLWLGRAMLRRTPGHGLGRLFLVAGGASVLHVGAISLADARMVAAGIGEAATLAFAPSELPLDAAVPFWLSTWLWIVPAGLAGTLLLLLFPDGRLPSRRWWPVVPVAVTGIVLVSIPYVVTGWPGSEEVLVVNEPPLDRPTLLALMVAGGLLLLGATLASVVSLLVRWRTAASEERRQVRAVAIAGGLMGVGLVGLWPWQPVWVPLSMVLIFGFIATYVVAVLRYRLHDLDVAINRTVVGSVIAAMVTAVYLVLVVGVGSLVGRSAQHPLLPLLAVGVVAVLTEPARRRVRRVVDRLLYGRDADAYQVLSALAEQLRDAGTLDTVTARVTELLVHSTGAEAARITMETDGERRTLAASGQTSAEPILAAAIVHDGSRLGDVALFARSSSDLAPDAPGLLRDVAGTLGAVLRNALLTAELTEQVAQLRRSRRRLVTAQDEARRALERDLHDGAQARLVAVRLQLGVAASHASALPAGAEAAALATLLERTAEEADAAIRSLRDLSRGLHPPVLETGGVAAGLRAAARALPVEVLVDAPELGRYAHQVEAAVYFCCLEAINNAARHAEARRVEVVLWGDEGRLGFRVEDDGCGFDPDAVPRGRGLANLDDRIASLGGVCRLEAAPGRGTRVVGEVPAQPLVSER